MFVTTKRNNPVSDIHVVKLERELYNVNPVIFGYS
jgi:hypothetical protein